MIKRFFSLSLMIILATTAWAAHDKVSTSQTTVWEFSSQATDATIETTTGTNGLYIKAKSGTTVKYSTLKRSGTFSDESSWTTTTNNENGVALYLACNSNLTPTTSYFSDLAADGTNRTSRSAAFETACAGKLFIAFYSGSSSGTVNLYKVASSETILASVDVSSGLNNNKVATIEYTATEAGMFVFGSKDANVTLCYMKFVPETITTPSISQDGNSVTITSGTSSITGTTLTTYYTTDGTAPSATNGAEYTRVITLTESCTIKAITVSSGGASSEVASQECTYSSPAKTDISGATVNLSASSFLYNGNAQAPTVSSVVLSDNTLTPGTDYTVNEIASQTNVGNNYTVTVIGTGSYEGTASATWSITQATNTLSGTLSIEDWTYGSAANSPSGVTAAFGDVAYKYSDAVDGTYGTYEEKVNGAVGTWWVKAYVDGTDNYTAVESDAVSFTISPATPVNPTLTVTQPSKGGTIAADHSGEVASGTQVTITVTPTDGYQIKSGTLKYTYNDGEDHEVAIDENTKTFSMPAYNINVTAEFEPITFTISYYGLEGANLGGMNPENYTVETDDFTLINPTKDNAEFAGWTGTELNAASTSVTISKGSTGNREYTATWTDSTPTSYTLTPTVSGNGEIHVVANNTTTKIDSATEYDAGTQVQLVAVPNDGYQLSTWSGDLANNDIPSSIWLNAKNMTSNVNLTATFVAQPETVESISESRSWTFGSFAAGTKLSGTKTYHYNGLYICGHNQNHQNLAGIETAGSNSVAFEDGPTVNYQNYLWLAGGQSPNNAGAEPNVFVRDYVAFKVAVPGTVYVYMGGKTNNYCRIYSGGTLKTTNTALTSDNTPGQYKASVAAGEVVRIGTNSGAAYIYAIAFVPASYTFKATSGSNGSITVMKGEDDVTEAVATEGGSTYNYGTSFTLTATANDGYHFVNWTDGEESVISISNPYTISSLSANTTLKANFEADAHVHNFNYAVGTGENTNILTATCQNTGCGLTESKATLTLTADGGTYNGSAFSASTNLDVFNSATGLGATVSINYTGDNSYNSTDAPANAGTYIATATVTIGDTNYTLNKSFTIAKASITELTITELDAPVKGTALDTEVVCSTTGIESASVVWKKGETDATGNAEASTVYTAIVTLTASSNYVFAESPTVNAISEKAGAVTRNNDTQISVAYTFDATTADAPVTHTLTVNVDDASHGSVTIIVAGEAASSGVAVAEGASVSVTATANDGYELDALTVNGTAVDATNITESPEKTYTYSLVMPAEATVIAASFSAIANQELSASVAIDFQDAAEAEENLTFATEKTDVWEYADENNPDKKRSDYYLLTNNSSNLPINGKLSWRDPKESKPILESTGIKSNGYPFAIHNLVKNDEIIIVHSGTLTNVTATSGNTFSIGETAIEANGTITSGSTIKVTSVGTHNSIVLKPGNNTVISAIYINHEVVVKPEKVSAPTIALRSGFTNRVTITSGVSSYGNNVTTYYTTDGTEPTTESTSFTENSKNLGPYTQEVTIKAVSISETGLASAITSFVLDPQKFTITLPSDLEGGAVTANKETATEGETVKLTITPADGYYLAQLIADNGVTIDVNNNFKMPAANVTISATFVKKTAENANAIVTEDVKVVDETHATITSVEPESLTETTTVAVSGTVNNVPVTAIENGAFASLQGSNVQSVDLSSTQVALEGERSTNSVLKDIPENTLVYLPCTSSNVTGNNVIIYDGEGTAASDYTCNNFVMTDTKSYSVPQPFTATNATLSRSFTSGVTCTVCLPYDVPAGNLDGNIYQFSEVNGTTVKMTQKEGGLVANTPYIFVPSGNVTQITATSVTINMSGTPNTSPDGQSFTFKGVFEHKDFTTDEISDGIYGFAADANHGALSVGQFVKASNGAWTEGMRAYLAYSGSLSETEVASTRGEGLPDVLNVVLIHANGSTTNIGSLELMTADDGSPVYNLNGQRVDNSYKGLVIKNGKKVVKK